MHWTQAGHTGLPTIDVDGRVLHLSDRPGQRVAHVCLAGSILPMRGTAAKGVTTALEAPW